MKADQVVTLKCLICIVVPQSGQCQESFQHFQHLCLAQAKECHDHMRQLCFQTNKSAVQSDCKTMMGASAGHLSGAMFGQNAPCRYTAGAENAGENQFSVVKGPF